MYVKICVEKSDKLGITRFKSRSKCASFALVRGEDNQVDATVFDLLHFMHALDIRTIKNQD
jgi:hypothetical protein